jgi:hypothetical protein
MKIRLEKSENGDGADSSREALDIESLLHPANAFSHPTEVVCDPDLSLNEKRAILASWASDACAVESAPALRILPAGSEPVTFDEVMDALRLLDEEVRAYGKPVPHYRRVLAGRDAWFRRKASKAGPPDDRHGLS